MVRMIRAMNPAQEVFAMLGEPILQVCLIYAALFLFLTALLACLRTVAVTRGVREANSFTPDGTCGNPLLQRLTRARNNYFENAGSLALIVLVAFALGRLDVLSGAAFVFLGARILQTTVHLISTTNHAVVLRAMCYFLQVAIQIYWVVQLFTLNPVV